jgi:hypothetical protein
MIRTANDSHVKFNVSKTELIHFYPGRQSESLIIFTDKDIINTVESKESVRWLEIWFDKKLTFKDHTEKRAAGVLRVFHSIKRLSNITKGLTQRAIRQLYIAYVDAVAAYGVPI